MSALSGPRGGRRAALPSPHVRFGPDFLARLGRLAARLASLRERREGAGRARLYGVGAEFVGFRPYRSGADLRALDWNLFARLARPFVRVAAREASERWAVLVDASASMGVGVPGKLQLAAAVATGIAALGLARRARTELFVSNRPGSLVVEKRTAITAWMRRLEETSASGDAGIGALVREAARVRSAGRVFLVGDLLDLEPALLAGLARPSRELFVAQILAPEELAPPAGAPVRWVDAETGAAHALRVDESVRERYEELLAARLELWRASAARHRAAYGCWITASPFEKVVAELCA